ncbi:hypothetical protein LCGC14_2634650 [marine sediment metagenome]|uniref:PRTRC system protein C n=1 Tax=marine sediment metagenome TaxID=412755 RepID=A0A0F9CA65_9ZZZZ
MATVDLARVFRFSGRDLPDPCPSYNPQECLAHFAKQFPKLNGGKVVDPVHENGNLVFELRAQEFGAKG